MRSKVLLAGGLMTAAWGMAGCGSSTVDQKLDVFVQKIWEPRRSPEQYMLVAVSDPDPDARRDAVQRIAASDQHGREWAIKGFTAIALLENDPQARCVAVRGLTRSADPRAVDTLLILLNWKDFPPQDVRPPDDETRWDAALGLADLSAAGRIPAEQAEAVAVTLLVALANDEYRNVRIAAARGLGYYPESRVVRGLIDALRDREFAVVHQCEMSLARITGETRGCSVSAWEQWYESNEQTPLNGGDLPASLRPRYRNGWEKLIYDTREWVRFLAPGEKER